MRVHPVKQEGSGPTRVKRATAGSLDDVGSDCCAKCEIAKDTQDLVDDCRRADGDADALVQALLSVGPQLIVDGEDV